MNKKLIRYAIRRLEDCPVSKFEKHKYWHDNKSKIMAKIINKFDKEIGDALTIKWDNLNLKYPNDIYENKRMRVLGILREVEKGL